MKNRILIFTITAHVLVNTPAFSQNVAINATGANPHASAALDVSSTNKGLLIPRMTTTERNAISSPARGLMVYNLTDSCLNVFDGSWSGCLDQSPQVQTFPDLIGWGFGVCGITGGSRPSSFYQSHRDKLFYINTIFYFEGDSLIWQSRDMINDWPISSINFTAIGGVVSLGNYLYILMENRATNEIRIYRYSRANISAGGTLMSFSGQTLGSQSTSSNYVTMTSNGAYFYFTYNAGNSTNDNIIAKYSLSGTTLTYISNTTFGSVGDFTKSLLVDMSGNYYGITNNSGTLFKKFSSGGSLVYSWPSSQAFFLNWLDTFYSSRNSSYETYEKFNK